MLGTSQVALVVKNPPADAGDVGDLGSVPGWRRSPEEGNGNLPTEEGNRESYGQRSLEGYMGLQSTALQRVGHN